MNRVRMILNTLLKKPAFIMPHKTSKILYDYKYVHAYINSFDTEFLVIKKQYSNINIHIIHHQHSRAIAHLPQNRG